MIDPRAIDTKAIGDIIATYTKHGWILRRVLLCGTLPDGLAASDIFGTAEVGVADIDLAWFSRPPRPGGVAWEVRYLGNIPFALVEHLDEDNPGFEAKLRHVEQRLSESIAAKRH